MAWRYGGLNPWTRLGGLGVGAVVPSPRVGHHMGEGAYVGAHFDSWSSTGDRVGESDRFTADDLVAVTFSVGAGPAEGRGRSWAPKGGGAARRRRGVASPVAVDPRRRRPPRGDLRTARLRRDRVDERQEPRPGHRL
ncbi:hypothetical protein EEB14_59080 [Rhodococcus sp. WS4]|nr:hypothetical protein EEB14_59080 [Rhodococcus sp. WS4]